MAKTVMAVFSNPSSAERDDEYNAWYNDVHLKELMEIPGIVGATRYRATAAPDPDPNAGPTTVEHRYVALYEVEGDPTAVFGELAERAGSMSMSPALDAAGSRVVFWEAVEGGSAPQ